MFCNRMLLYFLVTLAITEFSRGDSELSNSNNVLAFDIYKSLPAKENVCFSPISISTSLAMLYFGCNGKTAQEIRSLMNYQKIGNLQEAYHLMLLKLKKSEVDLTNGVFHQKDYTLSTKYKNVMKNVFDAPAIPVDFCDNTSISVVNQWIQNATNNRINNILQHLDDETILLLLNAFYFRGMWQLPFNTRLTKKRLFYNENNTTSYVNTMKLTEKLPFHRSKEFNLSILELPVNGSRVSMILVLPDKNLNLTLKQLQIVAKNMAPTDVEVYLPKFKIKMTSELKNILKSLGIREAFALSANLGGISSKSGLHVSDILHKTVIDVSESGIETSSVSAIRAIGKSIVFKDYIFEANHPFIFILVDKPTNSIILMGNVRIL